jgi:uncharacterized protein involved in type VI secretion and phage assembly
VAGFPERLRSEADRAVAEALRGAAAAYEQQTVLLKKDAETDKRLAEIRVRTLEELAARSRPKTGRGPNRGGSSGNSEESKAHLPASNQPYIIPMGGLGPWTPF